MIGNGLRQHKQSLIKENLGDGKENQFGESQEWQKVAE